MKKKIVSLLLLLALAVGLLSSCAYSYEKDAMEGYTDFNLTAFEAALAALEIEDGDFTTDEATRQTKTQEKVDAALVTAAKAGTALTEGVIGTDAILTYCYYYTAEIGGKMRTFSTSTMKTASATTANLTEKEGLASKLASLLSAANMSTYAYTNKTDALVAGDYVFLTYTYAYTDGETQTQSGTATCQKIAVTAGTVIGDAILNGEKKAGDKLDTLTVPAAESVFGYETTVSSATIAFATTAAAVTSKAAQVTDVTYTEEKLVKDIFGVEYDLKDVTLHYSVCPISFYRIPELTARVVIENILGKNISTSSLKCFTDETLKYTEEEKTVTLKDLIDAVDKQYDETTPSVDYDALMVNIDKCGATVADTIVSDYKQSQYDTLLDAYREEIRDNLAAAVWAIIDGITVDRTKLPEKAVKEVYDQNYKSDKYTYYTGSNDSKVAYKDVYTLDQYMIQVAAGLSTSATMADAEAVFEEKAKEQVTTFVKIYVVAKAYDIHSSNTAVENFAAIYSQYSYYFYGQSMSQSQIIDMYGENNIRVALVFDELMDHILETEEEDEDKYVNLTYTIKQETT